MPSSALTVLLMADAATIISAKAHGFTHGNVPVVAVNDE